MQKDCTNISLAEVTKLIVQINPLNSNTENTDVQKLRVNFSILALKAWPCPLLNVFSKACNGLTWNGFKTAALKTGFYILDGKKSIKKPSKLAKTNQIVDTFQIFSVCRDLWNSLLKLLVQVGKLTNCFFKPRKE